MDAATLTTLRIRLAWMLNINPDGPLGRRILDRLISKMIF